MAPSAVWTLHRPTLHTTCMLNSKYIFPQVIGGTQADLKVKAQQNQLYVCRVNDQFCNCVFSDWVRVKVLDIVKPGMNWYEYDKCVCVCVCVIKISVCLIES